MLAGTSSEKFRITPRKSWYRNLERFTTDVVDRTVDMTRGCFGWKAVGYGSDPVAAAPDGMSKSSQPERDHRGGHLRLRHAGARHNNRERLPAAHPRQHVGGAGANRLAAARARINQAAGLVP